MPKVMISIPEELLERIDRHAKAAGETRSGFLQRLAKHELEASDRVRQVEIEDLLDKIHALGPGEMPRVDAAQLIREDRESH